MACHDTGHGGLAVARRPVKEVSPAEWETVLQKPFLALEEGFEIIAYKALESGFRTTESQRYPSAGRRISRPLIIEILRGGSIASRIRSTSDISRLLTIRSGRVEDRPSSLYDT
jgi:hypothetical protein